MLCSHQHGLQQYCDMCLKLEGQQCMLRLLCRQPSMHVRNSLGVINAEVVFLWQKFCVADGTHSKHQLAAMA